MKLAVILAFLFYGSNAGLPEPPANDPCENLKVETEIEHTSDGLDNGQLQFKVEGGTKPVKVYLFADKRENNRLDNTELEITNLKAGNYLVILQDGSSCKKEFRIIIK